MPGKISSQDEGDSQIVTFIFNGKLTPKEVGEWNRRIRKLKEMFGGRIKGVTVKGEKPPKPVRRRGRKR
jgi:hypothetical protein